MTTLLANKADFMSASLVKLSANIADDQLQPYIYAAQEYDLEPRLGEALYTAIQSLAETPDDTKPELSAFWIGKVKRFLVLASYRRFIAAHGLNVTQFGLTTTNDPQGTFNQAQASERAVILRQIDADANVALIRMTSEVWTFDGVAYDKAKKAGTPSVSIRAPKRNKYLKNYRDLGYKDIL